MNNRLVTLCLSFLCAIALAWISTNSRAAAMHPFHVCIGQMQWNPTENHWEVSLRMHPHDLEQALQAIHGKAVSQEQQDFQELTTNFLAHQFFLIPLPKSINPAEANERVNQIPATRSIKDSPTNPNLSQLKWIGMENERGWLWIHFELVPPSSTDPDEQLHLVHRIFLDRIEKQENSVAILFSRKDRSSLQFKKGQPVRPMPTATE